MDSLIVNFAPTGMVPTKEDTPYVPISPNEIVEQVIEAYEVGITIVHLHARDNDGIPTYKKSIYQQIIEGIKKHCPSLVLCVSLSGRNFSEFERRSEPIELSPDMGSLTLSSINFLKQASVNAPDMIMKLVEKMNKYGVKPELETFGPGMINYSKYLVSKKIIQAPYYYNIILGNVASAQMELSQAGILINSLPENSFWSFGGIGKYQLQANMTAIANGGGVRVGLEDNLYYNSETKELTTNIALIKRIHQIAKIADRKIMKAEEFGNMGFYNSKNRAKKESVLAKDA